MSRELTRRGFLKGAALLGGAAVAGDYLAGCSSIAPTTPTDQTDEKVCTTYCNACMGCPLEAVVRDDNVVLTRSAQIPGCDRDIRRMCARGASIPTMLVEDKRIKYPMRRVEGTERGAGQWERISWDEAISTICDKIKEYQADYGKGSVCSFTYGTTEPRNLWNLYRLENVAQFSHEERMTDFAYSQSMYQNVGGYYFMQGNNSDIIENLKTLVVWGHNPCVAWPNMWRFIANAQQDNDCKLIVIDPVKNTVAHKADVYVPIRPATDGALAMGIVNYLLQNGLSKDDYMRQKSCAPFLVKEDDGMFLRKSDLESGIQKDSDQDDFAVWDDAAGAVGYAKEVASPALSKGELEVNGHKVHTAYDLLKDRAADYPLDRVSEITGLDQDLIVEVAKDIVQDGPAEVMSGFGLDHYGNGFKTLNAVNTLRIVAGMVQKPLVPWSMNDTGFSPSETDHPTVTQKLGAFMFDDLLDTGEYKLPDATVKAGGQTMTIPGKTIKQPLKMLISFGGNLVNSHPDYNETVEAYKKFDFLVTTNVEWCDTADISDIVLPAAMIQESVAPIHMDDCFVYGEQCITPRFEAKPDFEIAKMIGQGLGLDKWFTEDMETAMSHTWESQTIPYLGVSWDQFKQAKILYTNGDMPLPSYPTSVKRLDFYLETPMPFEYFDQVFDPNDWHLPSWEPPIEAWKVDAGGYEANPLSKKYPLNVIAGTRRFRVHSYYGQNPLLREMEVNEPCVRVSPDDAAARGISDGDYVRLFNDRGEVVAKVELSAGVRPGVVDIDRGWQASQFKKGCNNALTTKQVGDWGCPNYSYHDCLAQMEKWNG